MVWQASHVFLVDGRSEETDDNSDDECEHEEEDGEVEVVEVLDHVRPVVFFPLVTQWSRERKLQNEPSSADDEPRY